MVGNWISFSQTDCNPHRWFNCARPSREYVNSIFNWIYQTEKHTVLKKIENLCSIHILFDPIQFLFHMTMITIFVSLALLHSFCPLFLLLLYFHLLPSCSASQISYSKKSNCVNTNELYKIYLKCNDVEREDIEARKKKKSCKTFVISIPSSCHQCDRKCIYAGTASVCGFSIHDKYSKSIQGRVGEREKKKAKWNVWNSVWNGFWYCVLFVINKIKSKDTSNALTNRYRPFSIILSNFWYFESAENQENFHIRINKKKQ